MDRHKRELLRAWGTHPRDPYRGTEVEQLQGRPPEILGGRAVVRQVVRLLRREVKLFRLELEAANERARGSEWWEQYIEGPVERELKETLSASVPRRAKETEKDYADRLDLIELRMRARLPNYERRGLTHER